MNIHISSLFLPGFLVRIWSTVDATNITVVDDATENTEVQPMVARSFKWCIPIPISHTLFVKSIRMAITKAWFVKMIRGYPIKKIYTLFCTLQQTWGKLQRKTLHNGGYKSPTPFTASRFLLLEISSFFPRRLHLTN